MIIHIIEVDAHVALLAHPGIPIIGIDVIQLHAGARQGIHIMDAAVCNLDIGDEAAE
jgi:hypothetical protein